MPLTHGILTHRYVHHTKLGRHQVLDARSLEWLHEHRGAALKPAAHARASRSWTRKTSSRRASASPPWSPGPRTSTRWARAPAMPAPPRCRCSSMTSRRAWPGWTPPAPRAPRSSRSACTRRPPAWTTPTGVPVDSGSSSLGIAKALRRCGLVGHYRHATTATAVASLLQTGPVLLGVPWFRAWFEPDRHGFVDGGDWASSPVAGGHEICGFALKQVVQDHAGRVEPESTVIRFRNSWSTSGGDQGDGLMTLATYQLLRRYIDALQLRK